MIRIETHKGDAFVRPGEVVLIEPAEDGGCTVHVELTSYIHFVVSTEDPVDIALRVKGERSD